MPDWLSSMTQTFEYYTVDPGTWSDDTKLNMVISCSITRDSSSETLGSATIESTEILNECYIRIYLITVQNGVKEKFPLGTYMVQSPSTKFDGKISTISINAYTPLIELKENPPPLGYSILKNANIMDNAYIIVRDNARAPVVKATSTEKLYSDFVANTDDTWVTFVADLVSNAKFEFGIDEMGRILFYPLQELESLQPVWTYTDDNSSILYPEVTIDHDIYGIPNVVEVIYSNGGIYYYAKVVNDDPDSPTSTVNRGREILYRDTDPSLSGIPKEAHVQEYAKLLLKKLSSIEYTISYKHGYCPVRLGDCVRLDYKSAGLYGVKAKVISQSIDCSTGCTVTEKAVYTKNLWG